MTLVKVTGTATVLADTATKQLSNTWPDAT